MNDLAGDFEDRYEKWRSFCQSALVQLSSSSEAYVNNPYFEAIVSLGKAAVPYIMAKLETDEYGHFLVHALSKISGHLFPPGMIATTTEAYPGSTLGNQAQAKMWIDWWAREGQKGR
jgi:hypothetical protein